MKPLLSGFIRSQRFKAAAPHIRGDVLDIGCGLGWFPLALSVAGHPTIGVDENLKIIQAVRKSEAIKFDFSSRFLKRNQKMRVLKRDGQRQTFDLITACGVNFGYHDAEYWGPEQYHFFVRNLFEVHLSDKPYAKVVFLPNKGENTDFLFEEETWTPVTDQIKISRTTVELRRPL